MSTTFNIKYKQEIYNAITQLERVEEGSSCPKKILVELKEVVLEELNYSVVNSNFNLNSFKSGWITRITSVIDELNLSNKTLGVSKYLPVTGVVLYAKQAHNLLFNSFWHLIAKPNKRVSKENWESILSGTSVPVDIFIDEVGSSSSITISFSKRSSTFSLSYQTKLSAEDRLTLEANHMKINKKWLLNSGACVEDSIYKKMIDFSYENPLHSYIINTNDEVRKSAFKPAEVEEIMEVCSNNGLNNPLPIEILDVLSKLDKKKNFNEIYQVFKNVEADRYEQRVLYWLKESVLNYIDLFFDESQVKMYTEQDLLEEVYGFIRRSRTLFGTRTETASGSMASSESKNGSRSLGANEALTRQAAGDHADLAFKTISAKVACVEIGLEDLGSKGTKELQEKLFKTPKMMKAFCARITDQYPKAKTEEIKIIEYLISGMYITVL